MIFVFGFLIFWKTGKQQTQNYFHYFSFHHLRILFYHKFCILLTSHCVELSLNQLLVKCHPALIAEDIDKYNSSNDDFQTIGYVSALKHVKNICHGDFLQYECVYFVEKLWWINYCDVCGNEILADTKLTKTAISDFDTPDYITLCQFCAIKAHYRKKYIVYKNE